MASRRTWCIKAPPYTFFFCWSQHQMLPTILPSFWCNVFTSYSEVSKIIIYISTTCQRASTLPDWWQSAAEQSEAPCSSVRRLCRGKLLCKQQGRSIWGRISGRWSSSSPPKCPQSHLFSSALGLYAGNKKRCKDLLLLQKLFSVKNQHDKWKAIDE